MVKVCVKIIVILLYMNSVLSGLKTSNNEMKIINERKLRAEYAHNVASMNKENKSLDGKENILLVKTDGRNLEKYIFPHPLKCIEGPNGQYTLAFQSGEEARKAMKILQIQEGIVYAEMDQEISAQKFLVSDREYKKLRSLGAKKMGFDLLRQFAGEKQGENSCIVAVIDSGAFPHSDYAERLVLTGYDYVDMDQDATSDFFGHGTAVTGILADCTENLNVSFLPIRVLNAMGKGKISNLINGIYEAVDDNADILNLSLATKIHSEALEEAVKYAISYNCTVVFAAGNDGNDISGYCPCHMDIPGLIVVGSAEETESGYCPSYYSNYGTLVDVYAFGTKIECCSNTGSYRVATGTSFATPHISAGCAILRLIDAQSSPQKDESKIKMLSNMEYQIPVLSDIVPQFLGVSLKNVELSVGDVFCLKDVAEPQTCQSEIKWMSSNEAIAKICNGNQLKCIGEGICIITGTAEEFYQESFQLHVSDEDGVIKIPNGTVEIQEESFADIPGIRQVTIPESTKIIDERAFKDCSSLVTMMYSDHIVTPDGELWGSK